MVGLTAWDYLEQGADMMLQMTEAFILLPTGGGNREILFRRD
jgi:hypothetical protein